MAEEAATGTISWAERWLSADRLAPYLAACGGDCERALELYEWNISLAHACGLPPSSQCAGATAPRERAGQITRPLSRS